MPDNNHHTSRGKWSDAGVPHKGWTCVDIDDLEAPNEICQMCEDKEIRFVHYMSHPDYPHTLGVGCVCAEHMESDYVRPKERERRLRSLARRRKTWFDREWRENAKGNLTMRTEGFFIRIFRGNAVGKKWVVSINRHGFSPTYGKRSFDDLHNAKDAALRALIWAKDHL